jgi:ubiquinone/menaquinone biosynthesis C-methylase UbiE
LRRARLPSAIQFQDNSISMLPLTKQNAYRERYRHLRPGWQTSGEVFEALTRQRVGPEARVLDLGCGRGGVMELLWPQVKLAVGLDPDHASLIEHRAKAKDPSDPAVARTGMRLACGLGEALPFSAASFDLVIGMWVLEHLAQPERVLGEIRRVLRAGGHFVFITPNARHPLIMFNRFSWAFPAVQRLLVPRLYGRAEADTFRVHYGANTLARLRGLAARHSFQVVALRAVADPTYLAFNDLCFHLSMLFEGLLPDDVGIHVVGAFGAI